LLEDQPNNIDALILYGSANYYLQNYKDVITAFEKITSKGINEIQVLAILGDAYFNTLDYKKAIDAYEKLILLQNNIPAIINIGRSYQSMEEPDHVKALEYFLKVYDLEPANYYNLLLTGDCYLKIKPDDFKKAFEFYQKAFDIDPNNINLIKAMANCIANLTDLPVEVYENVMQKWIELEPQNAYPYLVLGDYYRQKDANYEKSFEYYYQGFPFDENNLALLKAMDECLYNINNVEADKTSAIYKKFIELDPQNPSAYNGMAHTYMLSTPPDYENACDYYYRSFLLKPTPELIDLLFSCFAKLQQPDAEKIDTIYTSYKTLAPDNAKPYLALSQYYAEKLQPDFDKAENIYTEALKSYPSDKDVLSALGKFYQVIPQPDIKKSLEYLNESLKQDPDDFLTKFYLGWGNFISGNYAEAKKNFQNSLSNKTDEGIVYQNLGHIAFIEKDMNTAKDLYGKSLTIFNDKKQFYEASLSDWQYIEPGNADKTAFEKLLNEVMG
jgi:tetratricopeptide (TPR) repeat protein